MVCAMPEPCVRTVDFIPRMRKTGQHLFPSRIRRNNHILHHNPLSSSYLSNSQTPTALLHRHHPPPMTSATQTETPTQPHPESTTTPPSPTTAAAAAASTNAPPQNPSPISKIPFRPKKTRKLSPDPAPPSPKASTSPNKPTTAKRTKTTAPVVPPKPLIQQKSIVPIARSLSCDGEIDAALHHLRAADPLLTPLIAVHQRPTFDPTAQPPFLALARSILYQQLAYKAGTTIYTRFIELCGGESCVLPTTVLSLTPPQLRQIGVSGRKASYLHDLARKYQNGILSDEVIVDLDDKSLFTMLTMVNGIGSWSVHMFMIFSLHRPDVLPINDLGVRKGVQLLHGMEELPRPSQMEQLCEKWRPYRSVGAWYMWRLVEAKAPPSQPVSRSGGGGVTAGSTLQLQKQEEEPQQQQFVDPINGILNIGACSWGQS